MSKDGLNEPLLDEDANQQEQSVKENYQKNQSVLSAALQNQPPHMERSIQLIRPQTKMVSVHYWSQYRKGEHYTYNLEVNTHRVLDLIEKSKEYFIENDIITDTSQEYILRFANKKGKPKSDNPVVDVGRPVIDTGHAMFALCDKKADMLYKKQIEEISFSSNDTSVISENSQPVKESKPQEKQSGLRRMICCCFN